MANHPLDGTEYAMGKCNDGVIHGFNVLADGIAERPPCGSSAALGAIIGATDGESEGF